MLNFILWNLDPDIIDLGFPRIRYYGLMFVISFIIGYYIIKKIFQKEKQPEAWLDTLLWYMMIGIIVGARLGHCLFYQPAYYLANPIEILKVWEGGLASHGAGIGIIVSMYIFSKRVAKKPMSWIGDRIVIVVALGALFIRLGNLANSEIYGDATGSDKGFVYVQDTKLTRFYNGSKEFQKYVETFQVSKTKENVPVNNGGYPVQLLVTFTRNVVTEDMVRSMMERNIFPLLKPDVTSVGSQENLFIPEGEVPDIHVRKGSGRYTATATIYAVPKHPTHLYESLAYTLTFLLLMWLYWKKNAGDIPWLMTGVLFTCIFIARFFIEFIKENQVASEVDMALNLGQKLSIPFIALGITLMVLAVSGKTKALKNKY